MFTGLIEEVGKVSAITRGGATCELGVRAQLVLEGTKVGDSICTNGICLTVTRIADDIFYADVMPETISRTAFSELQVGSPVNLERALLVGSRVGGHFVSGHIDGTARISRLDSDGNAIRIAFSADRLLTRYIVEKGSIAIDGISLTVASVDEQSFSVSIIPHTLDNTDLKDVRVGQLVNIECDMIGKYVEKLTSRECEQNASQNKSPIDATFLMENGFL